MKSVAYCFWRVPDPLRPGRTRVTRYRLSRDDALAQWPSAVEAGGHEVRDIPETQEEHAERRRSMSCSRPGPPQPGYRGPKA